MEKVIDELKWPTIATKVVITPEFEQLLSHLIAMKVSESLGMPTKDKIEKKYLTKKQVCEQLHVSLPTVDRHTRDGLLKMRKVGNRCLYDADHLRESLYHIPLKYTLR